MSVDAYINSVNDLQKEAFVKLLNVVKENIPKGFELVMQYKMPSFVVPHSLYPNGYHCKPADALPFVSIAAQKNFIALYHMGIYSCKPLYDWFVAEYPNHSKYKLDMGKSCIRFKKYDDIPYTLIGELMKKISVSDWIDMYEEVLKSRK